MTTQRTAVLLAVTLLLIPFAATAQRVPLPRTNQMRVEDAARIDWKHYGSAGAVVVYRGTAVTVDKRGVASRLEETETRVLTASGQKRLQVLRFDYDPATSELELLQIRVIKKDGTVVNVPMADALDLPQPLHAIYWPFRMKLVSLPPLEIGDSVVTVTRFTGFQIAYLVEGDRFKPPQEGQYFDVVVFGGEYPVIRRELSVETPASMDLQTGVYNQGLTTTVRRFGETRVHRFDAREIPAYPAESHGRALSDVAPKVVMATLPSWAEKSRWFYITNEPMFELTDAIRSLAMSIVKGKNTDEERIRALNLWVAHNIRYSGVSLGRTEGFTLHPATMTLKERMGVCKDKAGMLVELMRGAGYTETFAAMTMAGSRVEGIPADQFNHSVVVWKRPTGDLVLVDPTWAPLSRQLWSNAETEQNWLAGLPEGDTLRQTPAGKPSDNRLLVEIESRLEEKGSYQGSVQVSGIGYMDTALRRWFGYSPQNTWPDIFRGFARGVWPTATASSSNVTMKGLFDLSRWWQFEFNFEAEDAWHPTTEVTLWKPAAFRRFIAHRRILENLLPGTVTGRKRGLFFWTPKLIRYEETLRLPSGFQVEDWEDFTFTNTFGAVKASVSQSGKKVTLVMELEFSPRNVLPEDLDEYQALLDAVADLDDARLHLRRAK